MSPSDELDTVPFTAEHAASGFRSGVGPLDEFFRTQAGQNQRRNVSRTWVLERTGEGADLPPILGFYTVTLGAAERGTLPDTLRKKLPRYPLPVVIIGRLAVDERARGRRIGERLLLDAHERILGVAENAGGIGVIVDAKDSKAAAFYAHYGYEPLDGGESTGRPRRMFLPLQTIRAALKP